MAAMVFMPGGVICHLICRRQKTASSINTIPNSFSYASIVCAVIGVTGLIRDEAP